MSESEREREIVFDMCPWSSVSVRENKSASLQDLSEACHLALQCLKGALLEHKRISGGLGLPLSLSAGHIIKFSHTTPQVLIRCHESDSDFMSLLTVPIALELCDKHPRIKKLCARGQLPFKRCARGQL